MKSKGNPVCYYVKLCSQGSVKVDNRKRGKNNSHECGEHFCKLCKLYVKEDHFCFVQKVKAKQETNFLYCMYDIETMLLKKNEKGEREH